MKLWPFNSRQVSQKAVRLERVNRVEPRGIRPGESERRWESADTNRLNSAHWARVYDQSINLDLADWLEKLRARSIYETANNPMIEGIIKTHICDLIGRDGPVLQVQCSSKPYGDMLESRWREWWSMPDVNGVMTGVEFLRLWVRRLWDSGEALTQIVNDTNARGPIKLRLYGIHPRRLATPMQTAGQNNIVLGVEVNKTGGPVRYWIQQERLVAGGVVITTECQAIDYANMIHVFDQIEEGQVRGLPWLTTQLDVAADLRDYDSQVLDAAREAADNAGMLYSDHPNIVPVNLEQAETYEVERRTIKAAPPGWRPWQAPASQPAANYVDYRHERQRELGRPVHMPLCKVLLDSRDLSWSAARQDSLTYETGMGMTHSLLETRGINRLVDAVAREMELSEGISRPRGVSYNWVWPVMPSSDPIKEATAERIELENGTLTYGEALARKGKDLDATIANRQKDAKALDDAGLPPVPAAKSSDVSTAPMSDENVAGQKAKVAKVA